MKDGENKIENEISTNYDISTNKSKSKEQHLQTSTITVGLCNITDITMTNKSISYSNSYAL